jgi:hypothetical protein
VKKQIETRDRPLAQRKARAQDTPGQREHEPRGRRSTRAAHLAATRRKARAERKTLSGRRGKAKAGGPSGQRFIKG